MERVRKGQEMKETETKRGKIAKEDKHIGTHWEMDQLFYKYSRNRIETISSALTFSSLDVAPTCNAMTMWPKTCMYKIEGFLQVLPTLSVCRAVETAGTMTTKRTYGFIQSPGQITSFHNDHVINIT